MFRRRPRVELDKGDRLLAYGETPGAETVAATLRVLILPGGERIPWQEIDHARWDDGSLRLTTAADGPRRIELAAEGRLPEVVRERVKASIVAEQLVRLDETHRVRIVGRRSPADDRITWQFAFDPTQDPVDPGLQALADQALEEFRRRLGV